MTGQRKYWKSYAKSNLKGNWGIAIAAMLAVVAVNFIGNIFAQCRVHNFILPCNS